MHFGQGEIVTYTVNLFDPCMLNICVLGVDLKPNYLFVVTVYKLTDFTVKGVHSPKAERLEESSVICLYADADFGK